MRAETRPTAKRSKPRPLTEAEREMVEKNLGLVHMVVNSMGRAADDDSIQAGVFGLMRAVQLFDPHRGFKFSTYASKCIRSAIVRHRGLDRLIHIPVYVAEGYMGGNTDPEKYRADAERASRVARITPGDSDFIEPPALTDPSPEDRELRDALAREIAMLPRVQRVVIERGLAGDGRKTIADLIGIEESEIGWQREIALRILRDRLAAFS